MKIEKGRPNVPVRIPCSIVQIHTREAAMQAIVGIAANERKGAHSVYVPEYILCFHGITSFAEFSYNGGRFPP